MGNEQGPEIGAVGRVRSVNVGQVRTLEWLGRTVTSGIWKAPVAGRLAVRGVNLAGDDQADRRVHGGPDKAVYSYAWEDLVWWHTTQDTPLVPGLFGENLTLEGVAVTEAVIGEQWAIGSALFEVAQPRMPCWKLGMRMADPDFPDQFTEAGRPGAYLRILQEGEVGAGDAVRVVHRPAHGVTIREVAAIYGDHAPHIERLLLAPELPTHIRTWAARRVHEAVG
jgi:MOSC domain-containing protein YiiM